jgi:hypothetical protein
MMVVDLIYSYITSERHAVIVSSDDDLLPPMRLLVRFGMNVIHLHTHSARATPPFYTTGLGSRYSVYNL